MNIVGFGFYNISELMIENVHITQCGGPMPSTSTLYPNDTTFYFYESQSVTLFISYSSYIMLSGVNINKYYSFAILLININNTILPLIMSTSPLHLAVLSVIKTWLPVVVDQDLYCTLVILTIE